VRHWRVILLTLLGAQFLVIGCVQAWRDAPTFDERVHIPLGVTALTRHQLRTTGEHPPLPYALAAVPALLAQPPIPEGIAWDRGDGITYSRVFMRAQERAGILQRLTFLARLLPLAEGVAIGVMLLVIGRALFATTAGLIAAGAWFTLPLALGMSHIDGIDVATTLTTVLCAYALLRYLRAPTTARAVVIGAVVGLALLSTFAGFALLGATAIVVALPRLVRSRTMLLHIAVIAFTAWVAVWIGYRAISPRPVFRRADPIPVVEHPARSTRIVNLVPWPKEFETGFDDLQRLGAVYSDPPVFLVGHEWIGRRWSYWPVSTVVKLPASTLFALVVGGGYALSRRGRHRDLLAVAVPMVAMAMQTVLEARNLGARYLLPAFALGLVLGGGAIAWMLERRGTRAVVCVLAVAQLAWFWQAAPDSIAWTAPPFRPAYRNATDSNVDWGQDLYRLRAWAHGRPMYVSYFGGVGSVPGWPAAQPFRFTSAAQARGLRGTVAISASQITGAGRPRYGWLRAYCSVAVVGHTILVYHFDPLEVAADVPTRPAGRCNGTRSRPVER
jgi:4-amino-4-deoxy-L-arabinose transferase-like glycosyltransferase